MILEVTTGRPDLNILTVRQMHRDYLRGSVESTAKQYRLSKHAMYQLFDQYGLPRKQLGRAAKR